MNETQTDRQVVYVEKNSSGSNKWLKYLLGCAIIFALISCLCISPMIFLTSIASQMSSSGTDLSSRIVEQELTTAGNNSGEKAKVAIINVSGEITYSLPGNSFETGATSNNIIYQLNKANDDSTVKAVVMRFNTPGGEVVAAEPICNTIKRVSQNKPVYAFIDSAGASLGYLLPNCTKYIYSRPEAVTASIGVIIQAIDWYGVLENFGGKVVFITNSAGDQKSGMDIFQPGSETYKTYQGILDETYEYFVTKVYDGRIKNNPDITKEAIKQYADGRIMSGTQAKNAKLVDELGQFDEVISSLIKKEKLDLNNISVVEYQIVTTPFDEIFNSIQGSMSTTDIKQLKNQSNTRLMMIQR